MRIQKYDEDFETFLKDKEAERKQISLKRVHQQRELAMVKQELNMQSWWSALWKKSALEQSQSELETEIVSLDQQIDALWEELANDTAISLCTIAMIRLQISNIDTNKR